MMYRLEKLLWRVVSASFSASIIVQHELIYFLGTEVSFTVSHLTFVTTFGNLKYDLECGDYHDMISDKDPADLQIVARFNLPF
jgi:hypothetical protein